MNLLLIGSSTGEPQTLQDVFNNMPKKRNYPTVVVQHMPPVFTEQLAKNLARVTGHDVQEARDGVRLRPGNIVIAKGGFHLLLQKDGKDWVCKLDSGLPVNSCRPSVDVTFECVAKQIRGPETVACMLTGMGSDGAEGCRILSERNVPIVNQEASSCVVYGLPRAVDEPGITTVRAKPPFLIHEAEKFMLRPGLP